MLGSGLVLLALWGGLNIHVPMGRDQGVASYGAMVLSRGGIPYSDLFYFNFPFAFYLYRTAVLFELPPDDRVNLLHLVFALATCLAVYWTGRQFLKPDVAGTAALIFAVFESFWFTSYWNMAQKDGLAALPLAAALGFLIRASGDERRRSHLLMFVAGGFIGLAAQFKPTLGIAVLTPLFVGAFPLKTRAGKLAAALAGAAVSVVPLALHLWWGGALDEMIEGVFIFARAYGGLGHDWLRACCKIVGWMFNWRLPLALAAFSLGALAERGVRVVLVFALLLLAQVGFQMKFFDYQFIPVLAPVCLLAARGLSMLLPASQDRPKPLSQIAVMVIVFILLVESVFPALLFLPANFSRCAGTIDDRTYLSNYRADTGIDQISSRETARYLSSHTRPDEPVLVFGLEPGLYVLADRMPPTRFAFDLPLVFEPDNPDEAELRDRLRAEFMADLVRNPPAYIVVNRNDRSPIERTDSLTQMEGFPELKSLAEREYRLETAIGDYLLFKHVNQMKSAAKTGLGN